MAECSKPTAFSVAVVGQGIGGLSLALGLPKYDHTDVQIYETAHFFGGEGGAGVAMAPNAANRWESHAGNSVTHVVVGERLCNFWVMILCII